MVPAGFDDQIPKLGSAPPSLVLRHGDSPSPLTARRKHHTTNLEGRSSHLLGQRHPHVSCAAVDPGNKWLVLIRFLAGPSRGCRRYVASRRNERRPGQLDSSIVEPGFGSCASPLSSGDVFAAIDGSVRLLTPADVVRICENGHALPLGSDSLD